MYPTGQSREKMKEEEGYERERRGGLSLLQCLNDKIGGNLGMEALEFLLVMVSGRKNVWCQHYDHRVGGCRI